MVSDNQIKHIMLCLSQEEGWCYRCTQGANFNSCEERPAPTPSFLAGTKVDAGVLLKCSEGQLSLTRANMVARVNIRLQYPPPPGSFSALRVCLKCPKTIGNHRKAHHP